jgi:hypothetical protein
MTDLIATLPVNTPIGQIVLESDRDVLVGLRLPNAVGLGRRDAEAPVLKEAATQLEEYFAGERTDFDLRMKLDGTPFQREVWAELTRIPYGETISYGELARRVGPGQRQEPDSHHCPVPSRGGEHRHRGLRRRPHVQARAARAGGCHRIGCAAWKRPTVSAARST